LLFSEDAGELVEVRTEDREKPLNHKGFSAVLASANRRMGEAAW
jgi:hypothetical protein